MRIETGQYGFDLPEERADEIIDGITDEQAREGVYDSFAAAFWEGPVYLPLGLADSLLNALSEWERKQEGGE